MGNQGIRPRPAMQQVEWIRAGAIGNVKEVHVWTDRPIWPQGIDRPKDSQGPRQRELGCLAWPGAGASL